MACSETPSRMTGGILFSLGLGGKAPRSSRFGFFFASSLIPFLLMIPLIWLCIVGVVAAFALVLAFEGVSERFVSSSENDEYASALNGIESATRRS